MNSSPRQLASDYFVHPNALVESTDIGSNTRIWAFAHVMRGARIGRHCNIGDHAFIESGVVLGDNVTVKNGVSIWTNVTVEDNVFLGPNCVFTNDPNPRAYLKKGPEALEAILVKENSTVGANATLLCGVTIGRYAFIGAGTVVLRSVPDFALIVGNPGRQIGWMCVCARKLPLKSPESAGSTRSCPHCGRAFVHGVAGLVLQEEKS
jgi:UDP-2-acetamido-3-amino-2,3-dideoxy-glucuronate N-acetyltransferase